jgi:hypothetical protein
LVNGRHHLIQVVGKSLSAFFNDFYFLYRLLNLEGHGGVCQQGGERSITR